MIAGSMEDLASLAAKHAGDTVTFALKHDPARKALVVFDLQCPLSRLVTEAYRRVLPKAAYIDYDTTTKEAVLAAIDLLDPKDLVVMIQSMTFRLDEFRIRIELFKRSLAVIEHVHLERATDERQIAIYVDAMAYDPSYYRPLGHALKAQIDAAERVQVFCRDTVLTYEGGMEPTKLNVGDYEGMTNVGGTFPIGEVFSEPKDLAKVNGEVKLFAFAGIDHLVQMHEPFLVRIENGLVVSHEGPPSFQEVLDQISADEKVMVREFGVGLNPAMGKDRLLKDITAFERQKGLHFSLGEKHGVYRKPGFHPKKTHYHIDVFVDVERIEIDGKTLAY
ncbi:MAG TPA: hypothetical protein VL283_05425 [Candidatus Baltobacteraceae bacterium]|nr:hypothetical protein [Candidatus Baltobacteraceae bacterium]